MRSDRARSVFRASVFLLLALTAASVSGQVATPPPPAALSFLPTVATVRKDVVYESWAELKFPPYVEPSTLQRGKHWTVLASIPKETEVHAAWKQLKPAFLRNGWTVVKEFTPGSWVITLKFTKDGVESWANVDFGATYPGFSLKIDLVEVAPPPISLALAAPGSTPEKMASVEKGDFPYLAPLPGSKSRGGGQDAGPFWVTPKGASQPELVATGTLFRNYQLPALTNLLFVTVYHDALTKAGWTIVDQRMGADALVVAHYGLKGRNIWANLHNNSEGYSVAVADTGTQLGAALAKDCHVALYGVLFDFNQSTLQPSSDAVLQQVANVLSANKALKLEVQGHTDNVGNDAYNQTLSEARARSVVAWLTHHGVAADRLSSKGYGKTRPVATNTTDEGRAKNRRVEIADPACASKARP
jgi:outer membrane protein OmpA-like peptidoglycan-associated protein